jgi:hypothetical protein
MQLLMPTEWLLRDIAGGVDPNDDEAMAALARKYDVAPTLMAIRVGQLLTRRTAKQIKGPTS